MLFIIVFSRGKTRNWSFPNIRVGAVLYDFSTAIGTFSVDRCLCVWTAVLSCSPFCQHCLYRLHEVVAATVCLELHLWLALLSLATNYHGKPPLRNLPSDFATQRIPSTICMDFQYPLPHLIDLSMLWKSFLWKIAFSRIHHWISSRQQTPLYHLNGFSRLICMHTQNVYTGSRIPLYQSSRDCEKLIYRYPSFDISNFRSRKAKI